jgi:hypothetical protein
MPTTYTTVASYTFASAGTVYTFSSIPSTYTDLVLVMSNINSGGATGLNIRINGDTGSNYAYMRMYGSSSTINSDGDTSLSTGGASIGIIDTGVSVVTSNWQNYANTTMFKSIITQHAGPQYNDVYATLWANTTAINSIQFSQGGQNFDIGTNFTLYGILKA